MYETLRGKIAAEKKMKKLTNADIGKMAGFSKAAVDAFMSGARESDRLVNAIAKALGLENEI